EESMRKVIYLAVCCGWAGLSVADARAQQSTSEFDLDPSTNVLAPIQYKHLAVFPVVKKGGAAQARADYLTLAEGLKSKQVRVTEHTGGGQVNRVRIDNRSQRPLLVLGGEVILGGQQDRVIGKDTIVPPGQQVSMDVFCVERGRWKGGSEFTGAG